MGLTSLAQNKPIFQKKSTLSDNRLWHRGFKQSFDRAEGIFFHAAQFSPLFCG